MHQLLGALLLRSLTAFREEGGYDVDAACSAGKWGASSHGQGPHGAPQPSAGGSTIYELKETLYMLNRALKQFDLPPYGQPQVCVCMCVCVCVQAWLVCMCFVGVILQLF